MPKLAVRPHLQPYVDAIEGYMRERGWSRKQMTEMIYGRDAFGVVQGSRFGPTIRGQSRPNRKTIGLIKEKTGLDLSGVQPLDPDLSTPPTLAKTALAQFAAAERASPRAPPSPTTRVTLTATRTTGETVLSLSDVTAEQAVKILQLLVSSGVA